MHVSQVKEVACTAWLYKHCRGRIFKIMASLIKEEYQLQTRKFGSGSAVCVALVKRVITSCAFTQGLAQTQQR